MLQTPIGFGFAGVDVFFVLSGFLLALPFARHALGAGPRPHLGRYFRRRLLRVFPAYYAQLAILLAAHLVWRVHRHHLNARYVAQPPDRMAEVAAFLAAHSAPGDVVFVPESLF